MASIMAKYASTPPGSEQSTDAAGPDLSQKSE